MTWSRCKRGTASSQAELAAAQAEIEAFREQGDELPKTMAASLRRAAEIEEAASAPRPGHHRPGRGGRAGAPLGGGLEDGGGDRSVQRAPPDEGQSARGAEERRRRLRPGALESRARRAALSGREGDLPDRGSFGVGTRPPKSRQARPARRPPSPHRRSSPRRRPSLPPRWSCRRTPPRSARHRDASRRSAAGRLDGPGRGRACLRGEGRARRGTVSPTLPSSRRSSAPSPRWPRWKMSTSGGSRTTER